MVQIYAATDMVALTYAQALLRDAGIPALWLDQHMSMMEGSLGILPQRLVVDEDDADAARAILRDAGLLAGASDASPDGDGTR